jgi:hypothetical protein
LLRRKKMTKKDDGATALKQELGAVRERLSSDEAFYQKVVWLFQERRPMTQEKAWDEIDDFLDKADLIAEVMVNGARKK